MNGPPDSAKYEALIERLSEIQRRTAAGETDGLTASHEQLRAVIGFLHTDVRVGECEATRPLNQLQFAVFDLLRGAKPKLLFSPRDRKGAKGAPTVKSAVVLRSIVNVAFFVLHEYGGMSKDEAATWLASELARYGIKQPNGKAITARAIIRWGAERGGKSLKGSDEVFTLFIQDRLRPLLEYLPPDTPIRRAQVAAGVFVSIGRLCGF
jgi:hypothetical protein